MAIIQVNTDKGWTESIIYENCDFDKFYTAADILKNNFNVQFTNKLNDFDTLYWDFLIDSNCLTLYYNIYLGLSIYPTNFKEATKEENQAVIEVGQNLSNLLHTVTKA